MEGETCFKMAKIIQLKTKQQTNKQQTTNKQTKHILAV